MSAEQLRNLNPHRPAKCAMWLFSERYANQLGGSMDFWDRLSKSEKNTCRIMAKEITEAREELQDE